MADETVHEALARIERAHHDERTRRDAAEAMVRALLRIAEPGTPRETLERIVHAVRDVLGAGGGAALRVDSGERMTAVAWTEPALARASFPIGAMFERVLQKGRPVASFDVRSIPEWAAQPAEVLAEVRSALHVPLCAGGARFVLVLTAPAPAAFDMAHVHLSSRLMGPAAQAMARAYAVEEHQRLIQHQRAAIRTLSTPILEVWPGLLCVPFVGEMDAERAGSLLDTLLQAIQDRGAAGVVLDVTGIGAIDAAAVNALVQIGRAARLLGAECVVAGVSAQVARIMVDQGMGGEALVSYARLKDALAARIGRSRR